jgi:hypothetical protein
MLNFADLSFKSPPNEKSPKYTTANIVFDNGYGVRVIHFRPRYELAVTIAGKPVWNTPLGDRVNVRDTPEEITALMEAVQELPTI